MPVSLLNPIFGQFLIDTRSYQPIADDIRLVDELLDLMSQSHNNETSRAADFRSALENHYNIQLSAGPVHKTGYNTDGHLAVKDCFYLITECKNEVGSTRTDPFLQSAAYYYYSIVENGPHFPQSNLPCLHLCYAGKFIS